MRYGLSVKKSVAIEELMRSFNLTIEQLWRYKCRALRLSRHPRRSLKLKDYIEETEEQKELLHEKLDKKMEDI